jgi:DNA-binding MarR family transcriptional regulator
VQRLERAGFVRRVPSATDRRVVIVETTAAGHALRRDVEQIWARLEHLTVRQCRAGEQAVLLDLLERLECNLIEATGD